MTEHLSRLYTAAVLRRPVWVLLLLALLTGIAASQLGKVRIDASALRRWRADDRRGHGQRICAQLTWCCSGARSLAS
jgi:hypothetical protein